MNVHDGKVFLRKSGSAGEGDTVQEFITNDFIVEISFKDFRTDQKRFINDIDGLLKVELNFNKSNRQNVNRITETNNLIPII